MRMTKMVNLPVRLKSYKLHKLPSKSVSDIDEIETVKLPFNSYFW